MESSKGNLNLKRSMELLKEIGHQYTEWSTVYDISLREMTVAIDFDFSRQYKFDFKKDSLKTNKN